MIPPENEEKFYFLERFLLLMGNLCSVQLKEGKKMVCTKHCDFRKAEIKVLCRLSKPLRPAKEGAQGFSLEKLYFVILHATNFTLEIKVWVQFGLFGSF